MKTKKNELTLSIALYFYVIGMGIVFLMGMLFRVDLDTLRAMASVGTIGIVSALALSFLLQYLGKRNADVRRGPLFQIWKPIDGYLISAHKLEDLKAYLAIIFPQVFLIGGLSVGKTGLYSTTSIRVVLQKSNPHVSCEFELISSARTLRLKELSHEEETALYEKLALTFRTFGLTGSRPKKGA